MAESGTKLIQNDESGIRRVVCYLIYFLLNGLGKKKILPQGHHKAISLQKQLGKINSYILAFLQYTDVPMHNNASEQAMRNVKVKQKISGQFKSEEGARAFAAIRSIIDTAIKSGKEIIHELTAITNLTPAPR